ncbi:MAG: energy transducer TonB [Deltaproteobacteria bacterium]|nr:energy transducer TonB [Deltaproteobacteria bacterium]
MSDFFTATDAPPLPTDGVFAARYHTEPTAIVGAAGWLLRARDNEVDLDVAFKLIAPELICDDDDRARLFETVQACRAIHHTNLVRMYELRFDRNGVFYTMPFLDGLSLREIIDARAVKGLSFTVAEILPLFGQLVLALNALAPFGPHGSIRPNSATITSEVLKLTGAPHFAGLPRDRLIIRIRRLGMLHYVAPEARDPEAPITFSADVYSLSAILCEMLTGIVNENGEMVAAAAHQRLPDKLASIVTRGLADSPDDRFNNTDDLLSALAETVDHAPSSPLALPNPERVNNASVIARPNFRPTQRIISNQESNNEAPSIKIPRQKHKWLIWILVAVVSALAAAGVTFFWLLRQNQSQVPRNDSELGQLSNNNSNNLANNDKTALQNKTKPNSEHIDFSKESTKIDISSELEKENTQTDELNEASSNSDKDGINEKAPNTIITTTLKTSQPQHNRKKNELNSTNITPPVFISGPEIKYTNAAMRHQIYGDMKVACTIGRKGEVRNCRVIRSLPYMAKSVIRSLEARKYKPATRNGVPIELEYTFNIRVEKSP